ncbi:AAA family ATPase, partial [Streptomyces niveus]
MMSPPTGPAGLPLLEREPEIAAAAHAVEGLFGDTPSGGLLVYRGAAGLGKTALLAEVRRMGAGRCTVWSARGGETVTSVPFHVVRQLLQPALTARTPAEVRELLGDGYDIVGPALGVAPPGARPADPQGVRDGLETLFRRLAQALPPLIVVVDDAHWSDLESLAWLASFARRTGGPPILVVVAYRSEDAIGECAHLLRALGESARLLVTLKALTSEATAKLARATLGEHADDPFCREVWEVTGGNAYETVELLAKARDEALNPVGGSAGALSALGAMTRGTGLIARLEELGTTTTRFAWAAAILGTDISLELVVSLAGMGPTEAADSAERLRMARLLVGTDPLEFVHPLIATAVYRAIPPA